MSFDLIEPSLRVFQKEVARLSDASLDNVPTQMINAMTVSCDKVHAALRAIEGFSIHDHQSPTQQREKLIREYESAVEHGLMEIIPIVAFVASSPENVDNARLALGKRLSEIVTAVEGHALTATKMAAEAASALEAVKLASAQSGASAQASFFEKEARMHGGRAVWWQLGVLLVALTIGAYGVFLWCAALEGRFAADTMTAIVQITTAKIVAFFVLTYLLVFCARNANAHRNLWAQYKHRDKALQTYQAFAQAAKFEGARDLILGHAAAAIYLPLESGFTKTEGGNTHGMAADLVASIQRAVSRTTSSGGQA